MQENGTHTQTRTHEYSIVATTCITETIITMQL